MSLVRYNPRISRAYSACVPIQYQTIVSSAVFTPTALNPALIRTE